MAITKFTKVNDAVFWVLWRIDESLDELLELYKSENPELAGFSSIKLESRRKESLASRLALRHLLDEVGLASCVIEKDEFGKPHVEHQEVEISVSHARDFGAAAINFNGPVGIDLEYPRSQIIKIARKFLHESEKDWAGESIERLTKIWSAKEALYKLHGRTQLNFSKQLIVMENSGQILETDSLQEYDLHFYDQGEFWVSLAY